MKKAECLRDKGLKKKNKPPSPCQMASETLGLGPERKVFPFSGRMGSASRGATGWLEQRRVTTVLAEGFKVLNILEK